MLEEFEINQKNYIKDFTKTLENKTLIRLKSPKNNPYEKYLENFGFKKVDDIFEYQLDLVNLKLNKIIKPNNNFLFEKLSNKHVDSFKSFSENYFDKSKYYFDKRFEKKLVDKMYLEWFTKSIKSEYDDEILGITHLRTIAASCQLKNH